MMSDSGDFDAPQSKKTAKHDAQGVADLEKVTDNIEDKEIAGNVAAVEALEADGKQSPVQIKLKSDDIKFIRTQFELSKSSSEQWLKENHGDLRKTLIYLLN